MSNAEYTKHEVIICERCQTKIECKANKYTQCQCSKVSLNLNEVQYVSEGFDGCLCANCLLDLQQEYQKMLLE
ncbi:MAG TPA: cysteine-rich CWC family protein [Pelobium sp.]